MTITALNRCRDHLATAHAHARDGLSADLDAAQATLTAELVEHITAAIARLDQLTAALTGTTALTSYTVPEDPADPEGAALELIVRLPASLSPKLAEAMRTSGLATFLQDVCGVLELERTFSGLAWSDAKAVAGAICFDACHQGACAGEFLRDRAHNALSGDDGLAWGNRQGVARAFTIAAAVLGA